MVFVIQMDVVTEVRPNTDTHPAYASSLDEAESAGVEVLFLSCHVELDELIAKGQILPR